MCHFKVYIDLILQYCVGVFTCWRKNSHYYKIFMRCDFWEYAFQFFFFFQINDDGHLAQPITIQCIHSHFNLFQVGTFQLNTIADNTQLVHSKIRSTSNSKNPRTTARNVFFYQPFQQLYRDCAYDDSAKPILTDLNTDLLTLLRAVHEN